MTTCRTCMHYYPARGPEEENGACMDLVSLVPLFDEPKRCDRYTADQAVIAADKRREEERNRVPVRLPERWISEQTELKLRRHDWREGMV